MMARINQKNIINSIWLGMFIGLSIQVYTDRWTSFVFIVLSIFLSGVIGLVIGFISELLTALLPITIANPKSYFAINNLIAIIVTLIIILGLHRLYPRDLSQSNLRNIILIILSIIAIANLADYLFYRNTNRKLKRYQKRMKD